jgi:hypothetical protein
MNEKTLTRKAKYTLAPPAGELPDLITTCPVCGGEIELWSADRETVCIFCNHKIFDRETTMH